MSNIKYLKVTTFDCKVTPSLAKVTFLAETNFAVLTRAVYFDESVILTIRYYYNTQFARNVINILKENVLILDQLQWRVMYPLCEMTVCFINFLPPQIIFAEDNENVFTETNYYLLQCFYPDGIVIGSIQSRRPLISQILQIIQMFGKCDDVKQSEKDFVVLARVIWASNEESQRLLNIVKNGPMILNSFEFRMIC